MTTGLRKKYIGDKKFYMYVLSLAVPMVLQNVITNFVSMLDNIMVGQIGTEQMTGVSIVNQYVFLISITIFGAVAGPSIFGTQYYGKGDPEGQGHTMRFRIMECGLLAVAFGVIFQVFSDPLISLFLSDDDEPRVVAETMGYAKDYLEIIIWSFLPYSIGQAYASAIRECGETRIPMIASLSAVGANLFLDYALIFGKFGMPELGVKGAAYATVVAKIIEAGYMIVWTHTHQEQNKYIIGLYRSFIIPGPLFKEIIAKSLPMMLNEFLWALSMTVMSQCFSVYGIEVVAARNISSVLVNIFVVVYVQMGAVIGIIVGQKLGEGNFELAKDIDNKLFFFCTATSVVIALVMLPLAGVFPLLYNTEDSVRSLASYIIIVQALIIPVQSYANCCYFTLRSGGKTLITFLFDFFGSWIVMIPITIVLAYVVGIDVRWLVIISPYTEIIKCVAGYFLVRSNMWINRIV